MISEVACLPQAGNFDPIAIGFGIILMGIVI